jgi:Protein of unknown function (DUF3592)
MAAYPLRAAFAGVLLFVLGLGIAGGVYQVNEREQEQLRGWRRADATVVELLKRRTPEGEVPVPLIAFTTAAGERVSLTLSPSRDASPYYVSAPVKVLYDPARPQEAIIDTSARRWTRNALGGGAALILTLLGGYVAWYASRWDSVNSPRS